MKDLNKLFYPESIAIVGASENMLKWGSFVLVNIIDGNYKGKIFPIARNKDTIYGMKAYRSLLDIDENIDVAIIMLPSSVVQEILIDCEKKGIKNVVLVTSGFSEVGKEGRLLEEKLAEYANEKGINIVGPNTMGITNTKCKLYATGAFTKPKAGGISIIAQSGNLGTQIMQWAEAQNIGISKFAGSGNEAVLTCEDYLEYLQNDDDTSVILMYLEGVNDGNKFFDLAKKTTAKKPVIALKAGRTDIGSKAAQSHTGAIAGSYKIFETVMKQTGITIAQSPTDLLFLAAAFDSMPPPKGNRVGVITLGGGWGVITADECIERGMVLPPLPKNVYDTVDNLLPSFWSKGNPVDLVGQVDTELFTVVIEAMMSSGAYDAIVFPGVVGTMGLGIKIFKASTRMGSGSEKELNDLIKLFKGVQNNFLDNIIDLMGKYQVPLYPVAISTEPGDEIIHSKNGGKNKLVIYNSPEEAVLCLEKQYHYSRYLNNQE